MTFDLKKKKREKFIRFSLLMKEQEKVIEYKKIKKLPRSVAFILIENNLNNKIINYLFTS